jgi:uncharacterized Zn finger protein (UPF0148 family)
MSVLNSNRKLCPACGRPMKLVSGEVRKDGERYVCPHCEDDPLHDPAALKWADSPLKPPSQS